MSEEKNSGGQEKSNEATPARIEKARREGDVAQSKEVNAAAGYIGFYLALVLTGAGAITSLAFGLSNMMARPADIARQAFSSTGGVFVLSLSMEALNAAAPFLLLPAIGALCALFVQRAIIFAPSKIKPKLSKLSIIANAKKKYGPGGLVEFAKSAAKLIMVFIIFGVFFIQRSATLPADALLSARALPQSLLKEGVVFIGVIVLFSVAIAGLDLPWSRHQHAKRLKMTLEELKKESKENEGDPAMKQSRRQRGQAIATNKMLKDVPAADVVVVNPAHFAVALRWDRKTGGAPTCVAKGADEIAARIRKIAAAEGVPIRSDPPTARAIYATVEIGDEIHRAHYAAVAAAIHFADSIRARIGAGAQ